MQMIVGHRVGFCNMDLMGGKRPVIFCFQITLMIHDLAMNLTTLIF